MGVIVDELGRLYSSRVRGLPCRLEPAVQFGTYARWHREQISDSGQIVDFWLRHLADLPDALELPLDRPYTANRTYRARTQTMVLDVKLVRQLKKVGSLYGCTFFHLLLSSIHAWLNRLCGQEDFVVGIAAAGQIQAETAHWGASKTLVGHCVHLLPLRTRCRGELAFSKHMQAVQRMVIDAMDHQSVALSMLVPQLRLPFDSSRVPLVPVVFNLDRSSGNCLMDGLAVEIHPTPKQFDFFDLHLNAVETGTGIQLDCTFCIDLFDSSSVESWLRHLKVMLEAIADDPETRVADLPMLTEAERRRILLDWNQTESDYPRECCIHELFQAQAERSPHAVAVRTGGTALSYRKLDQEANLIGRRLAMAGFRPGAFAGICAARSPEMLAGLLGILKVGGAYVPLDPDFPRERLAAIIHDADIRLIVTQQRYCGLFSEYALPLICLDGDGEIAADGHSCIPAGGVSALHPAYIMYTSGSTGKPKGVVVCHRNVARLLFGIEYVRLGPEQTILQAAPLSFDASTFEIWGALLHGGECVLHAETIPTAAGLQREIRAHGISTMWLTAALFNSVIDEAPEALFGLQQLLIGGEALSVQHVKRALEALPGTKIVNGYGPTESTTFACTYSIPEKLNSAVSSIPIGRPLANTRVYVLDRYQNPVPAGVPGEIHIGGEGVALGYLNQPQLTAERFLPDPFGEGRLYKTGDRGRFRADSNLEFLGRVDRQLKIRGFRIEPEEIETALQEHAAVKQAVVLARLQRSGEKLLVAYIVSDYQPAPGTSILRDYLKEKLPEYMIPSTFVLLDSLPRTAGGKIDWKALPDPAENRLGMEEAYAAPRNLTEEILADIWSEVLSLDRIGIHENFFSLGGHSLLATQIISRANQAFQLDIPLRCLFDSPTVARLAVAVDRMLGEAATPDCR